MPRILSVNSGPFSFSSSILSLEKGNLEEFYGVSANTDVIDEGQSVVFSLQYRNIVTEKTVYWEILPSTNITYEDFSTLMNGTFQIVNSGVEKITITANKDFTNINEEITENFSIRFRENNSSGNILITSTEVDILDTSYLAVGQQEYITPGTYTFTVPENVNKISFVLIGGGGGQTQSTSGARGPGGGGLIYCNNLYVEEYQEIRVVVGDRGTSGDSPTDGGTSSLTIGYGTSSPKTIQANGGGRGGLIDAGPGGTTSANSYFSSNSSTFVGFSGGGGGNPGFFPGGTVNHNGGAGSAAGYSAVGAKGGNGGTSGVTGSGGSGGSGAGRSNGSGGGTGIWGQSTNGNGGLYSQTNVSADLQSGKAGSKLGATEVLSQFGGGSAGGNIQFSYKAGTGAVRIIWPGQLRQYPTTRTSDETPIS
jgi:hypothetical protein